MADILSPPEGQSSFSGIPSSQFVEDVESYMKGEESAEAKLKVRFLFLYETCYCNMKDMISI